jgi:hypothetical protein
MRKRFSIALAAVMVIIVLARVAWLTFPGPPNPIYQGKHLSVWLQYYSPVPYWMDQKLVREQAPDQAVRHVGTNAIPLLLSILQARDSVLTLKAIGLAEKLHFIRADDRRPANWQYEGAIQAFRALGATASNAIPELIQIYRQNLSVDSQAAIAVSIGNIGPAAKDAIPFLLQVMATNTNYQVTACAVLALGSIHAEPERVVPPLTTFLHDPRKHAPLFAATALGQFGMDAKAATFDLLELLKRDVTTQDRARDALSRIYGQPAWKSETSSESKGPQCESLIRAINGFGAMGTNAEPAVPALVKFFADPDSAVRASATNAIKAIDPIAAAKAGIH